MPRKKKCPGCGEDQALHKPGTANKHCEGLPTPGLPPSAKKGEETTQGSNLEALQQRKLDLQRALEAKKLQAEIDELKKQLAGDAPAVFGDKKKTAEETTLVDKQNTGEESTPGDEKKTGEESTPGDEKKTGEESTSVDRKNSPPESTLEKDLSNLRLGAVSGSSPTALLGKDDVTLDQLRQNTALQRAVEAKFDALTAPAKSAKGKRSILSPEQFVFSYDSAEPKKYDDLTQDEFLSGYMGLFLSPDLPDWEHQGRLKLMRFVCHRLTRYTWATVRAFHHAAIQRALRDPSRWQTDWDELKEFYFDGDSTKLKPTGSTSSAAGGKARTAARPCIKFNKDECRSSFNTCKWDHICSNCWEKDGLRFRHAESSCRRKPSKKDDMLSCLVRLQEGSLLTKLKDGVRMLSCLVRLQEGSLLTKLKDGVRMLSCLVRLQEGSLLTKLKDGVRMLSCLVRLQEGSLLTKLKDGVRMLSCLVRLQEGSLLTKLKDGVRSLPKNFYLDEDNSNHLHHRCEGGLRSGTDPPLNLDPSCCFHLIHGNEGEAIELVARSAEEAGLWVRGLRHLVMEMREESGFEHKPITNWQYPFCSIRIWLLECFSLVDGDRDGRLTWQEAMLLFDRLNIYDTSGKIQDMVQRAVEGPGLLDWEGFLGLYRTISTRQDLVVLLKKYSEGKDFLTAAELAQFLEKEQKVEDCSRGQCLDIIAHCEPREDYMLNGWLGLDGFTNYLMSHHGEIFDSSHHAVHQDMTQPLSHYYIATSHNTYLQGDQLLSESNVDMYAWVLQSGCRCVELDCWDGPEGDPIVYHGYTLTSRVYFRDVIDVINRYAFINNSYPVILCLENHCSLDQQRKMALYLTQILAGKLEVPPLPPGAAHLPSPQDLRGKILIMSKKLTPGIPSDTRCGEVSDEDSADEMEEGYKLLPGEDSPIAARSSDTLMESSCRKHIVESYARSKLATLAKSGKTVTAEKEHHKLPVSPRQRARLALANSPLIRRKRGGSSDHEDSERQRQRDRSRSRERKAGRSSSFSEADAVDAQDRKFGAKVLSDTFNKLTHRKKKKQPVKPPGLPTLHSQEQLQDVNDIIPDNKEAVVMETQALATAAVGEKAQGQRDLPGVGRGRKGGEKHTRRMLLAKELSDLVWYMGTVSTVDFKLDVPCWQVPSISENKATALSADHAADMAAFTRTHLFRIYPSARRVDSSNYDPQALWNMGCQM
ncbi:Phospholipase C eta, partial [Branchiostoma belcheri]